MNNVEFYKEAKSLGGSREALRKVHKKHKLKCAFESFRVGYYRYWKDKDIPQTKLVHREQSETSSFTALLNEFVPNQNPFGLPESLENIYEPYVLPKHASNILLLSDIHVPYHNIQALTLAIKYGVDHGCNTIFLNGDVVDFYAISRFEKDPRKRNLSKEILMTREFLATLRKIFPTQEIFYKCGNHDVRWDHYIMKNAPDLLGLDEFDFQTVMRLGDLGIKFIPDKQIVHAGKLNILHGHELVQSILSPVNIARGLYTKAKDNSICGHHHQTSEHTEKSINGKVVTCWSVGCLSELHPDYSPHNRWNHGFAHIEVEQNGDFEVFNKRIIGGKVR